MPFSRRSTAAQRLDVFAAFLREEATGGKLLLAATAVALLWANLAGGSYWRVWQTQLAIGPAWLHLDPPLTGWVWRAAAVPLAAAAGGMALPAVIALAVSRGAAADGGAWATPV